MRGPPRKPIFNQFQNQNGMWQKIWPWRFDLKCQKGSFRMSTHLSLSNSLSKRFTAFWGFGSTRLKDVSTKIWTLEQVIDFCHFIRLHKESESFLSIRMNLRNINLLWCKYSHHFPWCKYCMPINKNWSQYVRFNASEKYLKI